MFNVAKAVGAATVVTAISMGCSRTATTTPATSAAATSAVDPYRAEIDRFRQAREAKLRSDTGWLTIAGLHFLTQPETTFGSDAANDIVLPSGAPARVGTFL